MHDSEWFCEVPVFSRVFVLCGKPGLRSVWFSSTCRIRCRLRTFGDVSHRGRLVKMPWGRHLKEMEGWSGRWIFAVCFVD